METTLHNMDVGTVTVEDLGEHLIDTPGSKGQRVRVRRSRYTWQPAAGLGLPGDVRLVMECDEGADGIRRFAPAEGVSPLILRASLIGHVILQRQGMGPPQSFSYHVMRLLYQHASQIREHFGRRFKSIGDLCIANPDTGSRKDVLPKYLDIPCEDPHPQFRVGRFIQFGREAAATPDRPEPDIATCIRTGLVELARLNPLDMATLTAAEVRQLIRQVLFDLGPSTEHAEDAEIRARVVERLLAALERHIDDSPEEFQAWFFEKRDNLIHQIAKKKKGGGPIDRAVVRQVLLELTFQAYGYVARSMQVGLGAFLDGLSRKLSPQERELFAALYLPRPELGGLPLVMLYERFAELREAILPILEAPGDPAGWAVLLRVLQSLAEMNATTRRADVYRKQAMRLRKDEVIARRSASRSDDDQPLPLPPGRFEQFAQWLRDERGAQCRCRSTAAWQAQVEWSDDGQSVTIDECCADCGHRERRDWTVEQLKRIAQQQQTSDQDDGL